MSQESKKSNYSIGIRIALFLYRAIKKTGLLQLTSFKIYFYRPTYFFYKKYFEDPFPSFFSQYAKVIQAGHYIDVGANIGFNTLLFKKYLKENFKVFAFEPGPDNFKLLKLIKNKSISIYPYAIGDRESEVTLYLNHDQNTDHKIKTDSVMRNRKDLIDTVKVKQISLDKFCLRHSILNCISFIKIDVQGYERFVFNGMQEVVKANPTIILAVEYSERDFKDYEYSSHDFFSFFTKFEMNLYLLEKNKPLIEIDLSKKESLLEKCIKKKGYCDILATKQLLV